MLNPKWIIYHTYRRYQFRILSSVIIPAFVVVLMVGFTTEPAPPNNILSTEASVDSLLCVAHRLQGVPYLSAGKNESGFDCSGFTRYVFNKVDIDLHASAASQFLQGNAVHADSLQHGDLLFFKNTSGRIFHVGIYAGEEEGRSAFLHASSSRGIVKDYLDMGYFARRWAGARRIIL